MIALEYQAKAKKVVESAEDETQARLLMREFLIEKGIECTDIHDIYETHYLNKFLEMFPITSVT